MQKYIEKLQFITHDIPGRSHVEQATSACLAGAKWIQYRCFTKDDYGLLKDINYIGDICDNWGATLIVTDHIRFVGKGDIQGFHIEDMDADFTSIRQQLGDEFTLGGSANNEEQLITMASSGVDYAGLGPFSTTETKPNNLPILGLDGYEKIIKSLRHKGIQFPVLAVGGVTLADVPALKKTGIFGVAVSGAINFAENFEYMYQDFNELMGNE